MDKLYIGSHVSFNKDKQLLGCVEETLSYGGNCFMFYTGAPQNTRRNSINDELTLKAYQLMKEKGMELDKVIVHSPYIVNLCNEANFDFSVSFLTQEVERCNELGIRYMVLHPGSSVNMERSRASYNISKGLSYILDNTKSSNVMILLETMAGKGNEMGKCFEEIRDIIDSVNDNSRLGVCMDTCHLWDAGYDIRDFDEVLDCFDRVIGIDRLKCIHINDSKNVMGSHKDRHENIGFGYIGYDVLRDIVFNERLRDIPKILETPYVTRDGNSKERLYAPYKWEIEMLKSKVFDGNMIRKIRGYYE